MNAAPHPLFVNRTTLCLIPRYHASKKIRSVKQFNFSEGISEGMNLTLKTVRPLLHYLQRISKFRCVLKIESRRCTMLFNAQVAGILTSREILTLCHVVHTCLNDFVAAVIKAYLCSCLAVNE